MTLKSLHDISRNLHNLRMKKIPLNYVNNSHNVRYPIVKHSPNRYSEKSFYTAIQILKISNPLMNSQAR